MANYKGFEIDDEVYTVIRHMGNVRRYHEALEKQQISWDYLTVMAKLASLDNELAHAKKDFSNLTGQLLNRLGTETLNKSINEFAFKAQVAINVLNRNLFERTADIGFLALDDEIKHFLTKVLTSVNAQTLVEMSTHLKAHFQAYLNKYSVYQDVVLFDKNGQVLVRLDEDAPIICSQSPIIKEALETEHAYVEAYGAMDFIVSQQRNLVYAYRVADDAGEALGVIALCFKFENECEGIFKRLLAEDDVAMLLLLNHESQVIASSHAHEMPLKTQLTLTQEKTFHLINYKNLEYFACVKAADAYQGYSGAGWRGCFMIPVEAIFKEKKAVETLALPAEIVIAAEQGALFNQETKNISRMATQIQHTLDRSVWNGNVYQAAEKNGPEAAVSKVILGEIKNTGISTKAIFEHSISEIQSTIISTTLKECESQAALAIEMMDRNLYERANDCRWWALNTTLKSLLSQQSLQPAELKIIEKTLKNIHDLYTVYSNLMVFNREGSVLAVSNINFQHLVGTTLHEPWVHATCQLQNSEQYVVSDFVNTPLYHGQPSYIFASGIRDVKDIKVVGGVAIVFDTAPQLLAILQDVMHQKSAANHQQNAFAVFVDDARKVISSSSAQFKVGDLFEIAPNFLTLEKGQFFSKIAAFGEHYYAMGCAKSSGYREFKGHEDRYQQDVYAFVMIEIGALKSHALLDQTVQHAPLKVMSGYKGKTQLATFYVNEHWLSFYSECVSSAVSVGQLVPIHGEESSFVAGYMMYKGDSIMVLHTSMLMGAAAPITPTIKEVVVIKVVGKYVGLSIDKLGDIIDLDSEMIQPISEQLAQANKVVREIVLSNQENADQTMLKIMDIALIASFILQAS